MKLKMAKILRKYKTENIKTENSEPKNKIEQEVKALSKQIDDVINFEMTNQPKTYEETIRKSAYCHALKQIKRYIKNIMDGNENTKMFYQ